MKLTQRDRLILRHLEVNAATSPVAIARALRVAPHIVHYAISRFQDARILTWRTCVDTYRLGYERLSAFFALPGVSESAFEQLIASICQQESIALVLEMSGRYQLQVNIVGKHVAELRARLDDIIRKVASTTTSRQIAILLEHRVFGTRVLGAPSLLPATSLGYAAGIETISYDETDHHILRALMSPRPLSTRELARQLGMAPSTTEYRVRKLEQSGVISGYTYIFNDLGLLSYVVLIHLKTAGAEQRKKLQTFARSNPEVFYSVDNLGSWDYELGLVVQDPRDANRVVRRLYATFGPEIVDAEILSVTATHKVADYPFKRFP